MTVFTDFTTSALVAHAEAQTNLSPLEVALLDRLQTAMEEIDVLVAHLDNYRSEEDLQLGKDGLDGDS